MLDFWWSAFCPSYFLSPEASVKSGTTKMVSLHSSAASCKARATVQHLEGEKLEVIPHPPNSPDLAPCDLLFFFNFENRPCWQDIFVNSRPSKSCEFTTVCHTPFWVLTPMGHITFWVLTPICHTPFWVLTAVCHTPFQVLQNFPRMTKATAALMDSNEEHFKNLRKCWSCKSLLLLQKFWTAPNTI